MKDAIWITWESQPRNKSISIAIGVELYEMVPKRDNLLKYFRLTINTVWILLRKRPKVVFAQNPSIVLSVLCCILKKIMGFKLIIDEHNAGLFPAEGKYLVLNNIAKWIAIKSDFVIVTNNNLKIKVEEWGASGFVMPDPLPYIDDTKVMNRKYINKDKFNFLFICSWSEDEPYQNVLNAVDSISRRSDFNLFVTGNYKKVNIDFCNLPSNVELLGFIDKELYYQYLNSCSAVIVLTNRENCLNCGAYEAVKAEKPGILSDHEALREYFDKGFMYCDNSPEGIVQAIEDVITNFQDLKSQLKILKGELDNSRKAYVDRLYKKLEE